MFVRIEKRLARVLTRSTALMGVCGGLGHAAPPVPPAERVTQERIPADVSQSTSHRDFCTCDVLLTG